MNDIDVVYTMWGNLHKTEGMEVGQVGFHKQKEVIKPDLRGQREERDKQERDQKKKIFHQMEAERKEEEKRRKEEAEARSYKNLMVEDKMTSNKDGGNDSDDF